MDCIFNPYIPGHAIMYRIACYVDLQAPSANMNRTQPCAVVTSKSSKKSSSVNTVVIPRERLLDRLSHLKHPISSVPPSFIHAPGFEPDSSCCSTSFILACRKLSQVAGSLENKRLLGSRALPEQTNLGENRLRSTERAEAGG